jgi:MATE family multidrug resistance protein
MMLSMLFSALVIYLPSWYLAAGLGNHGLWLAFTLFNAARGVTLGLSFAYFTRHHRWLHWSRDQ